MFNKIFYFQSDRNDLGRCLTKIAPRYKRSAWPVRLVQSKRTLFVAVAVVLAVAWIVSMLLPLAQAGTIERAVSAVVVRVSDGDTIHVVTHDQTKLRVRLYGIDAQETEKSNQRKGQISKPGQPYGERAKSALAEKIDGQEIILQIMDIDRYRRMVGIVWLGDRCINLEMVREGHAEVLPQYLGRQYRESFMAAQSAAQAERLGIWALPDYESPGSYRKRLGIR